MAIKGKKTDNPARNHVNFLLTDDQLRMMDECAYELRYTRTDVIRRGIELVYREINEKKNDR